jgi:hypothetical protein
MVLALNIKHLEATHKLKTRNKPPHGLLTQASKSEKQSMRTNLTRVNYVIPVQPITALPV